MQNTLSFVHVCLESHIEVNTKKTLHLCGLMIFVQVLHELVQL